MTKTPPETNAAPLSQPSGPFHVVIAGGGVAAVEAALALDDLAGSRVRMTMLAPNPEFVYRPMTVREPFAYSPARRYPVAAIADEVGVQLVVDELGWVDAKAQTAHTHDGQELKYDALIVAAGAHAVPLFSHATTIDDRRIDEQLHGLIQDIEGGYIQRIAFVVPPRMAWPLPIYELALMTAHRAWDMNIDLAVALVTPETTPLAIFGLGASAGVMQLLADAGVQVITSAYAHVPAAHAVVIRPGDRHLTVDRIIALPELYGPSVRGLPLAEHGFIPVDPYCQVRGVERVFAAGDATDFAVKHGGIASQQADVAAHSVASLAGVDVERERFRPVIRGMLLTGGKPKYLTAQITGGRGFASEITDTPTWAPASKIAAKYLAPYLHDRDRLADGHELAIETDSAGGVEAMA